MSNSPLVSYTKLSPNHSGKRPCSIDRITPHCVVGQCSVETLGAVFSPTSRGASCNYGIGSDGRVGMYVPEDTISWCTSSYSNDKRAVTIECASNTYDPFWMNDKVYATLIKLCVDICKRNGKKKLLWLGDNKSKTLNYTPKDDEMIITIHRWFNTGKSCPGQWLVDRLGNVADEVTKQLNQSDIKQEATMQCTYTIDGGDTTYYFDGQKIHELPHPDCLKIIRVIYKANNGHDMPHYAWKSTAPWYKRLQQAIK